MISGGERDGGDTRAIVGLLEQRVHSIVSAISSLLERLLFLTSAGAHNSAMIHDLALVFGGAEVDRVLDDEHKRAFGSWLSLTMRQQADELTRHFETQALPREAILCNWVEQKPYQQLIPAGALEPERDLFLSDMETILSILKDAHDPRHNSGSWRT